MTTVFLGGTCNGSTWRNELIPHLPAAVSAYNPVVPDWTPACQAEEIRQRESCDYCLYVITPKMLGTDSIAEVADDSNKRPEKTIFCFISEDDGNSFTVGEKKSLTQVGRLVAGNGAKWFERMEQVVDFFNGITEDVSVVVVEIIGEANFIMEASQWYKLAEQETGGDPLMNTPDLRIVKAFCEENGFDESDIGKIDFTQTRTRYFLDHELAEWGSF